MNFAPSRIRTGRSTVRGWKKNVGGRQAQSVSRPARRLEWLTGDAA